MNEQQLQELARQLAARTAELRRRKHADRPRLRAVPPPPCPPDTSCDIRTRDSHIRIIRLLSQYGDLQLLVEQAMFGRGSLTRLSDNELAALHRDLERGRECINDDIGFDPAGLLRPRA